MSFLVRFEEAGWNAVNLVEERSENDRSNKRYDKRWDNLTHKFAKGNKYGNRFGKGNRAQKNNWLESRKKRLGFS